MNKKALLLFLLTSLLYASVFLLTKTASRPTPVPMPYALLPLCEKGKSALTLTTENSPICRDKESLYILLNEVRYDLYRVNTNETLLGVFPTGIITEVGNEFLVTLFTSKGELIKTIPFKKLDKESYLGVFYSDSFLVFSTMNEVTSAKELKSRIFILPLIGETQYAPQVYSMLNMVVPKDITWSNESHIITLEQPFDFLLPYTYHLSITSGSITPVNPVEKVIHFTISSEGEVTIEFEKQTHVLAQFIDTSKPLEFIGYTHTKTAKTVYNCKDFGQSLQITLRICTPSNEKTI